MNLKSTPSVARGVVVTPRLPDFVFDAATTPDAWFGGDPGLTATWSALSVIAGCAELRFIEAGRWLVERIDDPALAEETRNFAQQEAFHGAVHARFNRVLGEQGRPVEAIAQLMRGLLDDVERCGGRSTFLAAMLAAEQVIGEMGHAVLAQPQVFDDLPPNVAALWLWHCFEEVEHAAALHDGFSAVFGQSRAERDLRVLGAAYILVLLLAAWPAAAWACVPDLAARSRPTTWRSTYAQLFGPTGLMRGAVRNLAQLRRVDFHPFDMHDPAATLHAARDLVDPAWERPTRKAAVAEPRAPRPDVQPLGLRDVVGLARFAASATRRAVTFVRAIA